MNKGKIILYSLFGLCGVILIGVFIYLLSGGEKENESKPPVLHQDNAFSYSDMINQLDDERYNSKYSNKEDSIGVKKLDLTSVYFQNDDNTVKSKYEDDEDYSPEPVIYSPPKQKIKPTQYFEPEPVIEKSIPIKEEPIIEEKPIDPREELRLKKLRLESGKSTISDTKDLTIVVNGTQTIQNGQTISFRLLSDAIISGVEIKKNTPIYGVAKFEKYRVSVNVSSIRVGNQIVPTNMVVYGMDGQLGIPVKANQILSETKRKTSNEIEDEIDNLNIPGSSIITEIFTKDKNAKVKLINNHKLILTTAPKR